MTAILSAADATIRIIGIAVLTPFAILFAWGIGIWTCELAVRLWRRVKRACDVLSWMDEV